jgi:hypothetical protein
MPRPRPWPMAIRQAAFRKTHLTVTTTPSSLRPLPASSPGPGKMAATSARWRWVENCENQGYTIANNRLSWISSASGLTPCRDTEPDQRER